MPASRATSWTAFLSLSSFSPSSASASRAISSSRRRLCLRRRRPRRSRCPGRRPCLRRFSSSVRSSTCGGRPRLLLRASPCRRSRRGCAALPPPPPGWKPASAAGPAPTTSARADGSGCRWCPLHRARSRGHSPARGRRGACTRVTACRSPRSSAFGERRVVVQVVADVAAPALHEVLGQAHAGAGGSARRSGRRADRRSLDRGASAASGRRLPCR